MVAVRILLLAACAWAASAGPVGNACTPAETGTLIGPPIPLQTSLQPGIRDWKVYIPDLPQCPYGPAGAFASVCDGDAAPSVNFLSSKVIQVHRNGNLLSYGTVDVQVYCGTSQQQQNQPLLQHNHQHSSNNQHGQTNHNVAQFCQNVAKLCAQPTVSSGQLPNNLLNLGKSSQPALKAFSLHPGHLSLASLGRQLPLLNQRSQSQYLSLEQSSLPSLKVSELDQSHNPLLRVTHQSLSGQSSLPSLSVSPVSQTRSSLPSFNVSPVSEGHSSLQSLNVSPVSPGRSPLPYFNVSPLSEGHSSLQSLSVSPVSPGRSSLPSLSVSPVSQGQSSLSSFSTPVYSGHSPLLSLRVTPSDPLSLQDQIHNPLLRQSPQQLLHLGQSSQSLSASSLPYLGQSSLPLLQLRQAPQLLSSQSLLDVGQSPLLLEQTSHYL